MSGNLVVIDDVEKEAETTANLIRFGFEKDIEYRVPRGTARTMARAILHDFPSLSAAIVDYRLNGAATVRYDGIHLIRALKSRRPNMIGVLFTKRPIIDEEPRIKDEHDTYDLLWDKREFSSKSSEYMNALEDLMDGVSPKEVSETTVRKMEMSWEKSQEHERLLKRYHRLIDKSMLETITDKEEKELNTIRVQLDQFEEENETLQVAAKSMETRRKVLDKKLMLISAQLQELLEGH